MSKLSAFLQPLETEKQREVVISRRFVKRNEKGEPLRDVEGNYIPEPFVVRALSPEENDRLVKRCTHTSTVRGQRVETFDRQEYTRRAIVEATVEPNFRDPAMAARLFTAGMRRWNEHAIYRLGLLYIKGEGVPQDERRGVGLVKLAAEMGEQDAVSMLAARR